MAGRLSPLFTWRSAVCSEYSNLEPTRRLVALTLSLHMSERGDSCFPSLVTIAQETALSLSTVKRALADLEDQGWLERMRSKGGRLPGGRGISTRYRASVPLVVEIAERAKEQGHGEPVRDANGVMEFKERGHGEPLERARGRHKRARASKALEPQPQNPASTGAGQVVDQEQETGTPVGDGEDLDVIAERLQREVVDGEPLDPVAIRHAVERDQRAHEKGVRHGHNCSAYVRHIAVEETRKLRAKDRERESARERQAVIDECPRCDERGLIEVERDDGSLEVARCQHESAGAREVSHANT